jgi:hypothetical protein
MRCCRGARAHFADLDIYRTFVDEIVGRRNANNRKRIDLERTELGDYRSAVQQTSRRM